MLQLQDVTRLVQQRIGEYATQREPRGLYDPVAYIMQLGGKRVRPLLCAAGYLVQQEELEPRVLDACLALEVFHNFSLVHDDIMDQAPQRRGQPTVHQRWGVPTAILSGDVMLIEVYHLLRQACQSDQVPAVLDAFHQVAIGVCEGQQRDMDFEMKWSVTWEEYLQMIHGKTAVLLGGSLEIGALLGGSHPEQARLLGQCGVDLGLAFQLHDDWLDTFGDPLHTGKQPGGDILQQKKTALFVQAMQRGSHEQQEALQRWFHPAVSEDPGARIEAVKEIYRATGAADAVAGEVRRMEEEAARIMAGIPSRGPGLALLRDVVGMLQGRHS